MAGRGPISSGHLALGHSGNEDFDDESFGYTLDCEKSPIAARKTPQAMRKGAWVAQAMSLASLVLALISICLLAVVALHLGSGSSTHPPVQDIIGLANTGIVKGQGEGSGWYRTSLKTVVRKGEGLDTPALQVLPAGVLVWVAETKGRRAQVLKPIPGWMSVNTSSGLEVLRLDSNFRGRPFDDDEANLFSSSAMLNATKRLQAAHQKLNALRDRLRNSVEFVKAREIASKVGQRSKQVGDAVNQKAPKLGHIVSDEARKVINPEGVDEFFKSLHKNLGKNPGMQELERGFNENEMAARDMAQLQAQLNEQTDRAAAKA